MLKMIVVTNGNIDFVSAFCTNTYALSTLYIFIWYIFGRKRELSVHTQTHARSCKCRYTKPKPSYCCLNAEVNLVLFVEWTERLSGGRFNSVNEAKEEKKKKEKAGFLSRLQRLCYGSASTKKKKMKKIHAQSSQRIRTIAIDYRQRLIQCSCSMFLNNVV